jgi:hypothetical protein
VNTNINETKIDNSETSMLVDSNFIIEAVLNDKLDSTGIKLLSKSQSKLIKTIKDNNEKQR